jgi:hypothetical protein
MEEEMRVRVRAGESDDYVLYIQYYALLVRKGMTTST